MTSPSRLSNIIRGRAAVADGSGPLRRALHANAAFSLLSGLALVGGAGPLADALGVPLGISLGVGAGVMAFALGVRALSLMPAVPESMVRVAIAGDAAWVVASVAVIALPGLGITILGKVLIAIVAEMVATFGVVQALRLRGWRRTAATETAI